MSDDLHAYVERHPGEPRAWQWRLVEGDRVLTGRAMDRYGAYMGKRKARSEAKRALYRERWRRKAQADPRQEVIR